jgi:hypothetical protein
MNRHHVFVAFGATFLVLGLLVAFGGGCSCAAPHGRWNFGGTPSVDGVDLPHETTLRLSSPDAPKRIALTFGAAEVVVTGDASVKGVEAEVKVNEKAPGDASLVASDDGFMTKSASGAPVLVSSAKIRVPPGTPVKLHVAVGDVVVSGIAGVDEVSATSDAGKVSVRGVSEVKRIEARTSIGDVALADAGACREIALHSDTGEVRAKGIKGASRATMKTGVGEVRVETFAASESLECEAGTGDVRVSDVQTAKCRLHTGLGDVRAERSTFDDVYAHTGLGDVRLVRCEYKTRDAGTGLGDVKDTK